jgi:hypothetical protein
MKSASESRTADRERKIVELKKKIIKMYGSNLVNFLSYQTPVPVIYREDSPEERQQKLDEMQEIVKERELEYVEREEELLMELGKIVQRIRGKVSGSDSEPSYSYSAPPPPEIFCEKCGNRVREHFFLISRLLVCF